MIIETWNWLNKIKEKKILCKVVHIIKKCYLFCENQTIFNQKINWKVERYMWK
jgi:hypothetical protein